MRIARIARHARCRQTACYPALLVTIDGIELRLLRLPLVRHFETSFGRSVRSRIPAGDASAATAHDGWAECVAEHNPFYSSETTETAWHVITGFLAPMVIGKAFAHPQGDLCRVVARSRPPDGESGARDGGVGSVREAAGHAAVAGAGWQRPAGRLRACRSGSRTRSTSWSSACGSSARRATSASRSRSSRVGRRGRRARPQGVWRHPADGRCQRGVHARRRRTSGDARPVRSDDDRAAARLRRLAGSRGAAGLDSHADLPGRVDHQPARRRTGDRGGRVPHREHQARAASAATRNRFACTTCAPRTRCRCGTAACSNRASAAPHNLHLSTLPNFRLPGDIAASRRYYAEDLIDPAIDVNTDGTVHGAGSRPRHRRRDRAGAGRSRDVAPNGDSNIVTIRPLSAVSAALRRRRVRQRAKSAANARDQPRSEDVVDPAARRPSDAAGDGPGTAARSESEEGRTRSRAAGDRPGGAGEGRPGARPPPRRPGGRPDEAAAGRGDPDAAGGVGPRT